MGTRTKRELIHPFICEGRPDTEERRTQRSRGREIKTRGGLNAEYEEAEREIKTHGSGGGSPLPSRSDLSVASPLRTSLNLGWNPASNSEGGGDVSSNPSRMQIFPSYLLHGNSEAGSQPTHVRMLGTTG